MYNIACFGDDEKKMRLREKGYADYNFAPGEEKALKAYIRGCSKEEKELLFTIAQDVNLAIADELYYSLVKGVSYERLDVVSYMTYLKGDFYAYRRKVLANFRDKCGYKFAESEK